MESFELLKWLRAFEGNVKVMCNDLRSSMSRILVIEEPPFALHLHPREQKAYIFRSEDKERY